LREKMGADAKQLLLDVFSVQAAASIILAQLSRMSTITDARQAD